MTNLRGKVQHMTLALLLLAIPAGAQTTFDAMIDAVSDSALFSTIAGLQGFGTRWCLSGNTSQVSKWIRGQFAAAGVTDAVLDPFTYSGVVQSNVVATLPGSRYPDKEIIVGAHIDSRSTPIDNAPGADDDASGTAAVLEIARVMSSSGYHPSRTIRFVGFAAEEAGLQGSASYAQKAKAAGRDIILMINFDMIGYTSSANPERRVYIVRYPPDTETAALVSSITNSYTSLTPVVTTSYQSSVDSYSFAMQGYTALTFIEYVFNPYYHSTSDLLGALDSAYVRDITRAGLAAILQFDGMEASSAPAAAGIPSAAALYQNYPNPFNPSTVVSSQLPVASHVHLVVYDLLGREVAVLANEPRAAGSYRDTFNGSALASGVYIYRLTARQTDGGQAGSFVQSRTMVLLK